MLAHTGDSAASRYPSTGSGLGCLAALLLLLSFYIMAEDHSHSHSGHSGLTEEAMPMYFMNTWHTTLWFKRWETLTPYAYILSCIGLVLFAVLHEALSCYRSQTLARLLTKAQHGAAGSSPLQESLVTSGSTGTRPPGFALRARAILLAHSTRQVLQWFIIICATGPACLASIRRYPRLLATPLTDKLWLCSLYALNLLTGYLLMLAVMTYNTGYLAATVAGLALGYGLFFDITKPSDRGCAH